MLLQVSLLTLAVFQVANSDCWQDDIIYPVDLNYNCIPEKEIDTGKSPILLIHGLTTSYAIWNNIQQALAHRTGRRVCAIDLRNHGDSPWSSRADVEAMAVDVGHFLDEQNIRKVNLVGHSLGGKTSIHYALKHPERVDSLVVEDMRPNSVEQKALEIVQAFSKYFMVAIKLVPEGSTEEEARKLVVDYLNKKLPELGLDKTIDDKAAKNLPIRCTNGKCELKMNPYLLQQVIDDSDSLMTESKGLYDGPTLFIYGKLSAFKVEKDEANILKLFPNAKLVGVEGALHTVHGRHKEFEDEIVKLLNK